MARGLTYRGSAAALALALTAWGTTVVTTGPASAGPADCGVQLYPSLDASGEHAFGEILDLTEDGIYVGSAPMPPGPSRRPTGSTVSRTGCPSTSRTATCSTSPRTTSPWVTATTPEPTAGAATCSTSTRAR